jgi:hypothetical protein
VLRGGRVLMPHTLPVLRKVVGHYSTQRYATLRTPCTMLRNGDLWSVIPLLRWSSLQVPTLGILVHVLWKSCCFDVTLRIFPQQSYGEMFIS